MTLYHMDELKKLLDIRDLTQEKLHEKFQEIAEILMGNYVIKKGDRHYAIIEIEFYLYSPNHRDFITYPRKMEAGRWFFHPSGVDLTFKSHNVDLTVTDNKEIYNAKAGTFGGILIRGLYDLDNKTANDEDRYIFGPLKCVDLLWHDFDAFSNSKEEYPVLTSVNECQHLNHIHIVKCKRCINIKEENRQSKVLKWALRLGVDQNENITNQYCSELFNSDNQKYLYRFFNLPSEIDPRYFKKIPSSARPGQIFS